MITEKTCTHSDHIGSRLLPVEKFYRSKVLKSGYSSNCIECTKRQQAAYRNRPEIKEAKREYDRQFYIDNEDVLVARASQWCKDNKERQNEISRDYRRQNKKQRRKTTKKWRDANRALTTHLANKRRAQKILATPSWFEEEEVAQLYVKCEELTESTGIKHHVHHIVPLQQFDWICGLHCLANLIILTDEEHKRAHSDIGIMKATWSMTKDEIKEYLGIDRET